MKIWPGIKIVIFKARQEMKMEMGYRLVCSFAAGVPKRVNVEPLVVCYTSRVGSFSWVSGFGFARHHLTVISVR